MTNSISIVVPAWNSLEYLKILHKSVFKNTKVPFEFVVHDNGSSDGTEQWLIENGIKYTKSDTNLGFTGVNNAMKVAINDHIMIVNSDMYLLPEWDTEISKQIDAFKNLGIEKYTISSCLIEPVGDNPEYSIFYAGHDASSFNEPLLLGTFLKEKDKKFKKENTIQYSHPILFPKKMIEEVNYMDESYFPGWSSDHDLPMSFFDKGCRNFVMLGSSRVYHFVSKTFSKLPNEIRNRNGQETFMNKWGKTVNFMRTELIKVRQPFVPVLERMEYS